MDMNHMPILSYDDIEIGTCLGPIKKTPSLEDVKTFCRAYRMEESNRFTDINVARKEGVLRLIVPGVMSMAYLSQLITDWAPNISIKRLDLIFRAPVNQEKTIDCVGIVTDKEVRNGENYLECDLYILDADGQRPVTGKVIAVLATT